MIFFSETLLKISRIKIFRSMFRNYSKIYY